MPRVRICFVLLLPLLASCRCLQAVDECADAGGCVDAGYVAPPPTDPIERLLYDAVHAAMCEQYVACGIAPADLDCAERLWGQRVSPRPDYAAAIYAAIDAGRTRLDLDAGAACVRQMQTVCEPGCWPPWTGLVPEGGSCLQSLECEPGTYCSLDACPGRCTRKFPAGSEVVYVDWCATKSWVALNDGGTRCLEPIAEGELCASLPDEQGPGRPCARGLACHGAPRVCRVPLATGASCEQVGCAQGNICVGVPPRCTKLGARGEACGPQLAPCLIGLPCRAGVCSPPWGQDGDPCPTQAECARPFHCAWPSRTCVRLRSEGEICSSSFECGDYRLVCTGARCRTAQPEGGACSSFLECREDMACRGNMCRPRCAL